MTSISRIILSTIASCFIAGAVAAQSDSEFISAFSGDWYIFDPAARTGQEICGLTLSDKPKSETYELTTQGCKSPLSNASSWEINQGRIIIYNDAEQLAVLGGNQFRVTGEMEGSSQSMIIERAQGDGNSAKISAALRTHTCYFLGFTQQCASANDLQIPEFSDEGAAASIELLVNLIARAQPRRDAPPVGNIAQGARVQTSQCLTASDGPWCSAVVGDTVVWLAMTAVRLDEWPILTFRAAQPAEAS